MGQFNIKNETLETALSQVVLVSDDITRLNYDLFLKRFSGEDQWVIINCLYLQPSDLASEIIIYPLNGVPGSPTHLLLLYRSLYLSSHLCQPERPRTTWLDESIRLPESPRCLQVINIGCSNFIKRLFGDRVLNFLGGIKHYLLETNHPIVQIFYLLIAVGG